MPDPTTFSMIVDSLGVIIVLGCLAIIVDVVLRVRRMIQRGGW